MGNMKRVFEEICTLFDEGYSCSEVSEITGFNESTVRSARKMYEEENKNEEEC